MRKILYISGTRADYGLMRESLLGIKRHPELTVEIIITGMHLMPEFGKTINQIKKDRFKFHPIKSIYRSDAKKSTLEFIGKFILRLTKYLERLKPDIILVLGDRAEMLAAAIAGAYLMIPVAHIHGGDISSTVDEIARHAITKLAHIHFTATEEASQRIVKMGEDPWRVHTVGAVGLDEVLHGKLFSKTNIAERYNLNLSQPILLVIQHPVTAEGQDASDQMRQTLEAVRELGYQGIIIYPNADSGGRAMIQVIKQYRKYPFIQVYKNIPRKDYLSLMRIAGVLIGNSSSGIIEAPSFCIPVVNVGMRQKGRERAENIIDVDYDKDMIKGAVQKALYDEVFRKRVKGCKSPYGDGHAGEKIAEKLAGIKITNELLQKIINY